jgi:hypothetical protein
MYTTVIHAAETTTSYTLSKIQDGTRTIQFPKGYKALEITHHQADQYAKVCKVPA